MFRITIRYLLCSVFKVHSFFAPLIPEFRFLKFGWNSAFLREQAYQDTPWNEKSWISPNWWAQVDSNHRPHAYQACALTTWAMSPFSYSGGCPLSPWWRWTGSNRWPPACKAGALPAELHPHFFFDALIHYAVYWTLLIFTSTFP